MSAVIRRWPIAASSLAAVVLAACGSGDGGGAATTSPEGGGAPSSASMQAFRDCMREQGVELPEPSQGNGPPPGGQGGRDLRGENTQAALEKCQDQLPEGLPGPGPPPQGGQAPDTSPSSS